MELIIIIWYDAANMIASSMLDSVSTRFSNVRTSCESTEQIYFTSIDRSDSI